MSTGLLQALAVTAELCGAELSDGAARVMLEDLAEFPEAAVLKALVRVRREHRGKLTLSAVIERIDDGRPGADEAWALVPKHEDDTAVLSDEISKAMSVAMPMWVEGDRVGARMAFIETYRRIVQDARVMGETPRWFVSLGHESSGRAPALATAVQLGRISVAEAATGLSAEQREDLVALVDGRKKAFGNQLDHKVRAMISAAVGRLPNSPEVQAYRITRSMERTES